MLDLKISLVTVTYNAGNTIARCIESVIAQNFQNLEYIIVDGGSTDDTIDIIKRYQENIHILISESDRGIYDAMNKGIARATGHVAGILNADDYFAGTDVLSSVALAFSLNDAEIVYGDLDYVDSHGNIIRRWRSGVYKHGLFNKGWMPPHPTFYCKRNLFEKHGLYSLNYGTAADYELMLRFIHVHHIKAFHLNKVMIKMNVGGASNKSFGNRVKGLFFDLRAMRNNGILIPIITLIFKPLRKISQYFR